MAISYKAFVFSLTLYAAAFLTCGTAFASRPLTLTPLIFSGGNVTEFINVVGTKGETYEQFADKIVDSQKVELTVAGQSKPIGFNTCREYWDILTKNPRKDGQSSRMEGAYIKTCGALKILKNAADYHQNPFSSRMNRIDANDFEDLPRKFYDVTVYDNNNCPKERNFQSCLEKLGAKIQWNNDSGYLEYNSDNAWGHFTPMVLADMNEDETADMAFFYAVGAKGGTLVNYGYICVQKNKHNQVTEINCTEGNR